jgi:hypothetical protein
MGAVRCPGLETSRGHRGEFASVRKSSLLFAFAGCSPRQHLPWEEAFRRDDCAALVIYGRSVGEIGFCRFFPSLCGGFPLVCPQILPGGRRIRTDRG